MASTPQGDNSDSAPVDDVTGGSVDLFYLGKISNQRIRNDDHAHLYYELSIIIWYCNSKDFEGYSYTHNKNSLHSLFGTPNNMFLLRDLPITASLFHPRGIEQLCKLAEKNYLKSHGDWGLKVIKKNCLSTFKNIKNHRALFNGRDETKRTSDEVINLQVDTKKILFLHHLTLMAFRSLRKSIDNRWIANPDETVRQTKQYLVPVTDIIKYLRAFFENGRKITKLKGALKWFNIPPQEVTPAENVCIDSTLMVPTTLVLPTTLGSSTKNMKMQMEMAFHFQTIRQQQNDMTRAERDSVGSWTPSPLASPCCSTPTNMSLDKAWTVPMDADQDSEVNFVVEELSVQSSFSTLVIGLGA
jgi:hypothetical protein